LFLTRRPIEALGDLGGIEQAVLNLGAALTARGHRLGGGGITVAVNDASLLPAGPGAPVVWFHNEVVFWRELRRGRLPALLRLRPAAVFCGEEQARLASRFLPLRRRAVIPHGLPQALLEAAPAERPPGPQAIFISQAYRGLADVIGLWRRWVAPRNKAARLVAYIAPWDVPAYHAMAAGEPSIAILPRIANADIPAVMRGARLLLAPGHRAETFCLAAAEAIAMGVPVVTLGIGALKERVSDGKTGFICADFAGMAERTLALFADDVLWQSMQGAGLATRRKSDWDQVAARWEALFDSKN
jgi:glycosyltransferase involved in cell wall biosynthesis